ncbi:Exonuclease SbcC [Minicystis rosea]|nr:Exonuclease SbcC [Minicystis rosea]
MLEPDKPELWDEAERLAETHDRPEDVARAYAEAVYKPLDKAYALELCQRAHDFVSQWFEGGIGVATVLMRALDLDPTASWAFERLSMQLTVDRRWDALLGLYDKVIAATESAARRVELYGEAAQIAKDLAGDADRAIGYLAALSRLSPSDGQISGSLERLLEREGRWRELVDLWRSRLGSQDRAAVTARRAQIAACLLDKLASPGEALEEALHIAADAASEGEGIALIERVFAFPDAPADVQERALGELRRHYAASGKTGEIIRVLGVALGKAEPAARAALHREIAELLVGEGRDHEAAEHYASLLALDPEADDARVHLRALGERSGRLDAYADALARAAQAAFALEAERPALHARAVALLFEAASVREHPIGDAAGATELYLRVFRAPDVQAGAMLAACRRLDDLLGQADRRAERLEVLERRATLEPGAEERRRLRGEAARLSDALGDVDRALSAYALVLADDATDTEAHEATIALHEREHRWEELITALTRAADSEGKTPASRAHLVRAARVYADELSAAGPAVEAWQKIERIFGASEESVDALSALLGAAGRFRELSEVLERGLAEARDPGRRLDLEEKLGDVRRTHLGDAAGALRSYEAVLAEEPARAGAQAGARALLEDAAHRDDAVALLLTAFEATGDWAGRLSLLEHRLAAAGNAAERSTLLLEAAELEEHRAGDAPAALRALARALPLSPEDTAIEQRILRLAAATGLWGAAAGALGDAVTACPPGPRAAELHYQRGVVLDARIDDAASALDAYLAALAAAPDRADAANAAVRAATRLGRWDVAAETLVASARARGAVDGDIVAWMEGAAGEDASAWDAATAALAGAVAADTELAPALAGELLRTVAAWHRDRRSDPAAAEHALSQALGRAGGGVDTLEMLAGVQRRAPSRALVGTLLGLADAGQHVLASLHEAATVAVEVLHDEVLSRSILERLLGEVGTRLSAGGEADVDLGALAAFAIRELTQIAVTAGDHEHAVSILVEAAALPLGDDAARARLRDAAAIAEERLGDADRAVTLYQRILESAPDDAQALARLGSIFESAGRVADLLALRRHELSLADSVEAKLALRLSIAELFGRAGDAEARLAALRDNLADEPGHPRSLADLSGLLADEGRHAELATLLEAQAELVDAAGAGVRAAALWTRASEIAEEKLGDTGRALADRNRAIRGNPTAEAFDALARLSTARGEHAAAVGWLEQRLEALEPGASGERVATVARLAEALGGAGRTDAARAVLEKGLAEHPGAEALREPLRALYRAAGAWDALVGLLTGDGEAAPTLEQLREAADICLKKLGSRERAIPILEALIALAPTDRPARLTLASAWRGAGEVERARDLLTKLLEEYGRRRSPERAEVHFQLAQVAMAAGDGETAKAQLETATSISTEHAGALRMLAGLYRAASDFTRAERMYGALLLIALRQAKPGVDEDPERPARSEVMINLHWILAKLSQQGRSDEMLASAFEAARRSEFEAERLLAALREAGDHTLLLRALTERLERTDLDASARAALLSETAEILGGPLARPEEAFRALLDALALDPGSAALRDRAAAMARRAGSAARWAEVLAGLAEREEAEGRSVLAAGLFLSLAEIHERDLGDAATALPLYLRAELLGAEPVVVWRALDRVSGVVGDVATQIRVLRQLVFAGDAAGDADAQTETIYRLAELELASSADQTQGLASLEWALGREPRWDRAGRMLQHAIEVSADPAVLAAYERVARSSGDPSMLLDALDRSARAGTAGMEVVREAVDLAISAGDAGRVEALLARAIELGEANPAGMGEAVWALARLAERREAEGANTAALSLLGRAIDAAEHDEAQRLAARALVIAEERLGTPRLAAEVYERLLSRDRHDREVWQPLLALYRRIGDLGVLEAKLREAIECAFDAVWRSELRMERAKLLLDRSPEEAARELDEVLQEDAENAEAAALLTTIYEQNGDERALAELMERRLSIARAQQDGDSVLHLSLRLGELLARDRRDQAIDVYRAALDVVPASTAVMERLIALYEAEDRPEDRADMMERMLALETGRAAAERALGLAEIRRRLEDEDGMLRALDLGVRADPSFTALRDRLAALYTERGRWAELASMLAFEGSVLAGEAGVARLREAAAVYLDQLDQPADAAAALAQAVAIAPDDLALLVQLARCLGRAGQYEAAVAHVGAALDRGPASVEDRVSLLRLRAELAMADDLDRAVQDLETAYGLAPAVVAHDLAVALEHRRAVPGGAVDQALLLRLVALLLDLGDQERARLVIGDYLARVPHDVVVLRRAAEIEGGAGRWDAAVELCERLVGLAQGADKVEAALRLADACTQAGYPHDARPVLEAVFAESPGDARVRDHLRRIYEATSAHRELAELFMSEARLTNDTAERFASLRKAGSLLLESAGDPAAAVAPLEAARELKPRDGEVAMLLADAYIQSGRLQEAADFLDASIQAQKGRRSREVSMMQQRMAQIARAVGDRSNELAWLNAAFESDAQNGEAAAALADVATEFGQLEVALKALKAITLMKSPKPLSRAMAYLRQAMIAQHQGDLRKAQMLAKKAQTEDPHLEEATAFLAQLNGG